MENTRSLNHGNSLTVDDLSLVVGKRTLIKSLNWKVEAGQLWCVLGNNGAGKTTLLRALAGLHDSEQHGANISIGMRRLYQWSLLELAKQRAYLPQHRQDSFSYPVLDAVLAARHPYHDGHFWESDADREIAMQALTAMDVADCAVRDIRSLSGGERQRVAIAATMAQQTPLMLFDEPTNSLDLSHQISVMNLISEKCRQEQASAILVSHDLNLVYRYASHVLLMMPDATWHSGSVQTMMTSELLSSCLGFSIEQIQIDQRVVFLPGIK